MPKKHQHKKKKLTKSKCKYFLIGNKCTKFHTQCFDCKEYNKNTAYKTNAEQAPIEEGKFKRSKKN